MRFSSTAGSAFACLAVLLLAASSVHAEERPGGARKGAPKSGHVQRTVTRTDASGVAHTGTADTTWQRGDGHFTRDTVFTGANGKQATTHVDAAKTADGHVRDVTRTGPEGKTSTTHDELHRTANGYTRTATHTGPKGTTTVQGQGTWDPATKTWTRENVVTHPNGSTTTTQVTKQHTPPPPAAQ